MAQAGGDTDSFGSKPMVTVSGLRPSEKLSFLGTIAFAACGSCCVFFIATRWGALVYPTDWLKYLEAARGLIAGRGLSQPDGWGGYQPFAHFPPLFPFFVAGLAKMTGSSVETSVRILNAWLLGVSSLLAWQVARGANASPLVCAFAAVYVMGHPLFIQIHSEVLSEPLFICLLLALCISFQMVAGLCTYRLVTVAGTLAAALCLTRYLGLAILPAAALFIALAARNQGKSIGRFIVVFLAIATLPLILWSVRNQLVIGHMSTRNFGWHPPTWEVICGGWRAVMYWLAPESLKFTGRGLIFGVFASSCLGLLPWHGQLCHPALLWKVDYKTFWSTVWPFVWLSFSYCAILTLAMTFFDPGTPYDTRILLPIFLLTGLGIILAAGRTGLRLRVFKTQSARTPRGAVPWPNLRSLALLGLAACLALQLCRSVFWLQFAWRNGCGGYVSVRYHNSEALRWLGQCSPDTVIFSNDSAAVVYWLKRAAVQIPRRRVSISSLGFLGPAASSRGEQYTADMCRLRSIWQSAEGRSVLVWFSDPLIEAESLPTMSEVAAMVEAKEVTHLHDAVILR
jgi:hypothetical protein